MCSIRNAGCGGSLGKRWQKYRCTGVFLLCASHVAVDRLFETARGKRLAVPGLFDRCSHLPFSSISALLGRRGNSAECFRPLIFCAEPPSVPIRAESFKIQRPTCEVNAQTRRSARSRSALALRSSCVRIGGSWERGAIYRSPAELPLAAPIMAVAYTSDDIKFVKNGIGGGDMRLCVLSLGVKVPYCLLTMVRAAGAHSPDRAVRYMAAAHPPMCLMN